MQERGLSQASHHGNVVGWGTLAVSAAHPTVEFSISEGDGTEAFVS